MPKIGTNTGQGFRCSVTGFQCSSDLGPPAVSHVDDDAEPHAFSSSPMSQATLINKRLWASNPFVAASDCGTLDGHDQEIASVTEHGSDRSP